MSARILVVDDVEVNVRLLEAKLQSEYYDVLTAFDGPSALEVARRQAPDVILLDVMMPGMDGLEVCRRLKADPLTHHIPIVMVTALSDPADRLHGLEVGADDFLTKPVADMALFARVRSLVRLKRTLDEWLLREEIRGRLAILPGEVALGAAAIAIPTAILVLADSPLAGSRLTQVLNPHASRLSLVATHVDAYQLATSGDYDLLIIGMSAESGDPLRLLGQLRASDPTRQLPVILVLDEGDNVRLSRGLDLGANDYIFRPVDSNELIARMRIQIRRRRLQEQLLDNYRRGIVLALTDELTGLYNRRYLAAHLETHCLSEAGSSRRLGLLMFDIDHFKEVNDTRGHAIGDEVLVAVSNIALKNVRAFDLVARYGGEEFVVILPDVEDGLAEIIAERLREAIDTAEIAVSAGGVPVHVTISIGVVTERPEHSTPLQLLQSADEALYAAKRAGRNCVRLWRPGGAPPVGPCPDVLPAAFDY
jgi:two-component system cell cycle response regulator